MELDWSTQSPHIRSLFHPWQPGDGYDEATIQAAEARLGVRLPATLRNFYLAWGKRRDLTGANKPLLPPNELLMQPERLIFWMEDESVIQRTVQSVAPKDSSFSLVVKILSGLGVPTRALREADPPVVASFSGPLGWSLPAELSWRQSHAHLSDFLDDLTYQCAFDGGAVHGGRAELNLPEYPSERQIVWLEENWSKAPASLMDSRGEAPEMLVYVGPLPTLYVRDGQALYWLDDMCYVAVCEAEALDEIAQALQIIWEHRW